MLFHLCKNIVFILNKNQKYSLNLLSKSTLLALYLLVPACQGLNERVPSSAIFEIQAKDDLSAKAFNAGSNQVQSPPKSPDTVRDLNKASSLSKERGHFVLNLDKSSESKLNLSKRIDLNCTWTSALQNAGQMIPATINLEIVRGQSQLWLETKLPIKFKKALSSAYDHLPSYSPLNDQGGLWVLYNPLNHPQQSLFLAKPIPWMNDRAKVIARCKTNKRLTELTFIPLSLDKSFKPNHKLSLVSQELQVHSTTDKE